MKWSSYLITIKFDDGDEMPVRNSNSHRVFDVRIFAEISRSTWTRVRRLPRQHLSFWKRNLGKILIWMPWVKFYRNFFFWSDLMWHGDKIVKKGGGRYRTSVVQITAFPHFWTCDHRRHHPRSNESSHIENSMKIRITYGHPFSILISKNRTGLRTLHPKRRPKKLARWHDQIIATTRPHRR